MKGRRFFHQKKTHPVLMGVEGLVLGVLSDQHLKLKKLQKLIFYEF